MTNMQRVRRQRELDGWARLRVAKLDRALDAINRGGLTGNDRDRVIGQVWRDEHEMAMFAEDEAPAAPAKRADLRTAMEAAVRALNTAAALADGSAMPDALTIELAEAALRAAGRVAKMTRQAKAARVLEVAG